MDSPFHRLIPALLAHREAILAVYREPLAVVELPHDGIGIVVLDEAGAPADELRARADRVLQAHQAGVLYLVVAGGGEAVRPVLREADRGAPDPNRLGVYHLDGDGRLHHVAGRSLGLLGKAAARLATVAPLAPEEAPALVERGLREREEAARFAAALGRRVPRVTWALVAACVILYVLAHQWGRHGFGEVLLRMGANSALLVREGEVWRLLASAFLHGSVAHLFVNMLSLQSFGGFLELVVGARRYLLLYGAAALGGSLASAVIAGHALSVGASGALWGLMGAGFAVVRGGQGVIPRAIATRLRQRLLVVLVLNGLVSLLPGIDFSAHAGGGIVGFLLASRGGLAAPRGGPDPRWVRVGAALAALALAASVATALLVGRPWSLSAARPYAHLEAGGRTMAAHAGETARRTGDFRCENCRAKVHVTQGSRIPRCPNCGNDTFGERENEPGSRS